MAQNQERRGEMKKISRTTSGRGSLVARFLLFARFTNCRMTCPGLGMKAFGPSRRFSTQLWRSSRRAQLVQKGGQSPSHLRQRRSLGAGLPRSRAPLHQRTSQHQQIVSAGDDVRPALRPLRGTQPWYIPEQLLFVKAIAMLLRVAQAIRRADLGQRSRALAFPDKPTDLGVTSLATGPMTDDLDQRNLDPARRAQVQEVSLIQIIRHGASETSTQRAVRRCKWFQHRTWMRAPLASRPSQVSSGSPWLLSS